MADKELIIRLRAISQMEDAREAARALRELAEETVGAGEAMEVTEANAKDTAKALDDFLSPSVRKTGEYWGDIPPKVERAGAALEDVAEDAKRAGQEMDKAAKDSDALGRKTQETATNTKKAGDEMQAAGQKSKNMGAGVLEASRAFEDLQYGVRGVLNNIPTMVMSFGGGAGLAAALSFVAVAGDLLYRNLGNLAGAEKEAAAAAEELAKAQEMVLEKFKEQGIERGKLIADRFIEHVRAGTDALEAEAAATDRAVAAQQALIAKRREAFQQDIAQQQAAIEARRRTDASYTESQAAEDRAALARLRDAEAVTARISAEDARAEAARRQQQQAAALAVEAYQELTRVEEEVERKRAEADAIRMREAQIAAQQRNAERLRSEALDAEVRFIRGQGTLKEKDDLLKRAEQLEASAAQNREVAAREKAQVESALAELEATAKSMQADYKNAAKAADEAAAAMQDVVADVELQKQAVNQIAEIAAKAKQITEGNQGLQQGEEAIREAVASIQATAEQSAGGIRAQSAQFQQGLAGVLDALKDGLQPAEVAPILQALQNLRGAQDARDASIRQALEGLIQRVREQDAAIKTQQAQIRAIRP